MYKQKQIKKKYFTLLNTPYLISEKTIASYTYKDMFAPRIYSLDKI